MLTRPLTRDPVHWQADQSAWDGYRDAGGALVPLELRGRFELADGPLTVGGPGPVVADSDAGAVHFAAPRGAAVSERAGRPLLDWYGRVRRPLPWRATRDPYALLVSEVMLQQTQAARVVPYYETFLARFPDPAALAAAPARDVLAAWSGLGYNRRALALQRAAAVVAERGWPDDLTELPGVGPYTAAAVAAFAWDAPRAAVDVNARRVIERWDGRRPARRRSRPARPRSCRPAAPRSGTRR